MGMTDGGYSRNESCSLSYIFTYLWGRRTIGRIAGGYTTTYASVSTFPKSLNQVRYLILHKRQV